MSSELYPIVGGLRLAPAGVAHDPTFNPANPTSATDFSLKFGDLGAMDSQIWVCVALFGVSPLPADLRIIALPKHLLTWELTPLLNPAEFPVVDSPFSKTILGPGAEDYAKISLTRPLPSVFRLHIDLLAANVTLNGGPDNWFLVIKTATPGLRATWAVGTTPAEAERPWIHVNSSTISFNGGQSIFLPAVHEQMVTVDNYGTGSLSINAGALPGAPGFEIVTGKTIAPVTSDDIQVRFTAALPAGDHDRESTIDAASTLSNDALPVSVLAQPTSEHNATLSLYARVGQVDTVLVLDASGSMSWAADGTPNPPAGTRRWDHMVIAAHELTAGYRSFLPAASPEAGRLSVVVFPDVTQSTPQWYQSARVIYPAGGDAWVDDDTEAEVVAALSALDPIHGTPMGEGIGEGMGKTVAMGAFADVLGSTRWLVLMSDGAHNSGATAPSAFYTSDTVPDFVDKQIRVLTVAYGDPGSSNVDHGQLSTLALNGYEPDAANAKVAQPDQLGADIRKRFQEVLASSLNLTFMVDPEGVLVGSQVAEHAFEVNELQANFGLFVDWFAPARVIVELSSPLCERFDETAIRKHPQMRLSENLGEHLGKLTGFKHVFVDGSLLDGKADGRVRYGTWTLSLRAEAIEGQLSEKSRVRYSYSILGATTLRLRASAQPSISTGAPLVIDAQLHHMGLPVRHAHVAVELDLPAGSINGLLARVDVPDDLYKKLLDDKNVGQELGRSWALKTLALRSMQVSTTIERVRSQRVLDEQAPGLYRTVLSHTSVAGIYRGRVIATGTLPGGTSFRREQELQVHVEARPEPNNLEVGYEFDDSGAALDVIVEPLDRFGTPVLLDPATLERLVVKVSSGETTGDWVNELDGRYRRHFRVDPSESARISIAFDGQLIFREPLPAPRKLQWFETVKDYRPGRQQSTNKYRDPKQALGPVSKDGLVALAGPRGSLELSTKAGRFRASSITVFVKPTRRPRPYRVEVASPRGWVQLGDSRGATKHFEVPARLRDELSAVRIVDLSSDDDDQAPGVLLQGVGYELVRGVAAMVGVSRVLLSQTAVVKTVKRG